MTSSNINYFSKINASLKEHNRALPFLIVDLDRLDQNIDRLQGDINENANFRIVVKSLPCYPLIRYVMNRANVSSLMVFHQPFLSELSELLDDQVDVLLGKPMPRKTMEYYYRNLDVSNRKFNPSKQVQWLIDTEDRLQQYLEVAKKLSLNLKVNLEIDVGLHRGGFTNLNTLRQALRIIREHPSHLTLSGMMGYDPHLVKVPSVLRSKQKSLNMVNEFYKQCKTLLNNEFQSLLNNKLTFNGAGSPTFQLHKSDDSPLNDISAGSCLVKPTTFDIPELSEYLPACFIATPVLKKSETTSIPGLESIKGMARRLLGTDRPSYFLYGGFWKGDYCYPEDIKMNKLFGKSTNQTMINTATSSDLEVDDFVFLRPHQSEFVFLQFGKILALRNGVVVEEWEVLRNSF